MSVNIPLKYIYKDKCYKFSHITTDSLFRYVDIDGNHIVIHDIDSLKKILTPLINLWYDNEDPEIKEKK